jgi:hypothetical protein
LRLTRRLQFAVIMVWSRRAFQHWWPL